MKRVPDDETRVRVLEIKWGNDMSYENSILKEEQRMTNLFFHRIKKFCNLFSNFCLVSTVLAVSHGKWVSFYSIISKKWMSHHFFLKEGEVTGLFRNGN